MCFPRHCEEALSPLYKEDGELNIDQSYAPNIIPPDVHQHADSLFLNSDINSEDSIFGFIYQSSYEVLVVYTSDEAEELCEIHQELVTGEIPFEDPFADEPFIDDYFEEQDLTFEEFQLEDLIAKGRELESERVEDTFEEYSFEDPFEDYPLEEYSSDEFDELD